jgi:hypothetical protein
MIFSALLMLAALGAEDQGDGYPGDMIRFMDSTLPAREYIVTHAQKRDGKDAPWEPVIKDLQCFRSKVDPELRVVYWRKDNVKADYYGEIFTYDDALVRLWAETFPPRTAVDPPDHSWDDRPDRFRLFVDRNGPAEDWSLGRVMAPVDASTDWRFSGRMDTRICSSWPMYHDRTAPKWQDMFLDNDVFIERHGPFSTTFDGDSPDGYAPDPEFTQFDEVIVINQCMENDAGRERFFFARKGDTFFGIVRWDNSVKRDGEWVVTGRTVGLRLGVQEPAFSFAGMRDRVLEMRGGGPQKP